MFYIGVDLGQRQDYTAIAVVEKENLELLNRGRVYSALPPLPPKLLVRRIERAPLGTSYPQIVERIRAITHEWPMAGRCRLAVDATGVGGPVVDMLRACGTGCEIMAVTITGGDKESRRGSMHVSVPRRDLLEGVRLLIEKGQLRIASRMKEAAVLMKELVAMRSNRETAEHDDIVFAVALACWRAGVKSVWAPGRLPGI